ncbi:cryptochrome/photolyase family protein [Flavobacteriaceae sp. LMIT009]
MSSVAIIFPHQLFQNSPLLDVSHSIYLVEEYLFFSQYKFHKAKLVFHRASMRSYKNYLINRGKTVHYINANEELSDIRNLINYLVESEISSINIIEPTDNWLEKRIKKWEEKIVINWFETPMFINKKSELTEFFNPDKQKYFHTSFYKKQRKDRQILIDAGEPVGGHWTYDKENRKKFPKHKVAPPIYFPEVNDVYEEAIHYVETNFKDNYGKISKEFIYPINHKLANKWFEQFLEQRFLEFGAYEDAILIENSIINHSLISPLLNVGLLNPKDIIERALLFSKSHNIPINSVEGFIRQILGWREFIRGVYESKGSFQRNKNFWQFQRNIPKSFYNGSTGIPPIDVTIKKVLNTGYVHHIERLMLLGNFMLLCEFHPNQVYKWFMELFVDGYDWVMVPNVYGMSLFADGGLMSTKPYVSGSNYIMKMSNYTAGPWQEIWDGLFWNFMNKHRTFFLKNPRLSMLIRSFDKMPSAKKEKHLSTAKNYIKSLET